MFTGTYTAIVTPFQSDNTLDEEAFRGLIDFQINNGVDGIVPVGTTGESPTLNYEEHHRVIEVAVEACRDRGKVIAGTGGNSTDEALELTQRAKDAGSDGTLQVTPYYNKPSQAGLIRHFSALADIGLPMVLYNIPGRSALEIDIKTIAQLAQHPNIIAVKEAGGSVDRVSHIRRACAIDILSGDDALTLPMMIVGAVGVISVASNIIPKAVSNMVHAALAGDWATAGELHATYHRLFCELFIETNPVPVKSALSMMGKCMESVRGPLSELSDSNLIRLEACLRDYQLI